MKTTYLMKFR